jgi:SAM-dependent methyltransferase
LQLFSTGLRICELPIPIYYGTEICRVNGIGYAWNVMVATLRWKIGGLGLLTDAKYERRSAGELYEPKLDFPSTHSWVADAVPSGTAVLDIGCAGGHVSRALHEKGCRMIGIDCEEPADLTCFARFLRQDLDGGLPDPQEHLDYVLALDVIEHLKTPDRLLREIHLLASRSRNLRLVISTGNVAFFLIRLMLLLGQFNYGPRGILDATHTRLFTFGSLRRMLADNAFAVERVVGIPAPLPLALGRTRLARVLLWINGALIRLSKGLFAYQMLMVCRPVPAADWLLGDAVTASLSRMGGDVAPSEEAVPN